MENVIVRNRYSRFVRGIANRLWIKAMKSIRWSQYNLVAIGKKLIDRIHSRSLKMSDSKNTLNMHKKDETTKEIWSTLARHQLENPGRQFNIFN